MNDMTENQFLSPTRGDLNIEKDDSFDAELSLLETTLTELKEEHQPSEKSEEKHCADNVKGVSQTNILTSAVDIEVSRKAVPEKGLSVITMPDGGSELKYIKPDKYIESSTTQEHPNKRLSTIQHVKSTDDISSILSFSSLESPLTELVSLRSDNSCKNDINIISSGSCFSNIEDKVSLKTEHSFLNSSKLQVSDIIVSHCDSSIVEPLKIENTTSPDIESKVSLDIAIPSDNPSRPSDLSTRQNVIIEPAYPEMSNIKSSVHNDSGSSALSPAQCDQSSTNEELSSTQSLTCVNGSKNIENVDGLHPIICGVTESNSILLDQISNETPKDIENLEKSPQTDQACIATDNLSVGLVKSITNKSDLTEQDRLKAQFKQGEISSCKSKENSDTVEVKTSVNGQFPQTEDEVPDQHKIYCSTPVAVKEFCVKNPTRECVGIEFELASPLNVKMPTKNKINLKRKILGLECIAEECEENTSDICADKKIKLFENFTSQENNDFKLANNGNLDTNSSKSCLDTPAKSILKKWQPSYLSRNSGSTSFLVLDECGGSDTDESNKPQDALELTSTDDFEVAYKSLTEELMKSSSNIETLEKYHTQVQMESQMDDEKFDEVLQELISNYALDDKKIEESVLSKKENSSSLQPTVQNVIPPLEPENSEKSINNSASKVNTTIVIKDETNVSTEEISSNKNIVEQINKNTILSANGSTATLTVEVSKETYPGTSEPNEIEVPGSSEERSSSEQTKKADNLSILYADGKDMTMDEEDFLLEEDISAKKKPYVFFEFVSNDPQENEDNYNPEWQKLGRLTSDEERYKAVRDRWRSLVPPDPNRDLTCRQWREKNHKPPLNFPSLNNNHPMHMDGDRNQLCTAVFERKIKRMIQDLDDSRLNILRQRNMDFEGLARAQDEEQRSVTRCGNVIDLVMLRKSHIQECRVLKNRHDQELKRITEIAEEKIRILKEASDEVLLFQRFYKGVGTGNDEICLHMTDIQVQELMETEEMLDQYTKFYQS